MNAINLSVLSLGILALVACGTDTPSNAENLAGNNSDAGNEMTPSETGSNPAADDDEAISDPNNGPEPAMDPSIGEELNGGWIGGACRQPADCSNPNYTETPTCLTAGFPEGMCTQRCTGGSSYCPDATNISSTSGYTTTRCIESPTGNPQCVSACDFAQSPTGCRPGYRCVRRQRFEQPDSLFEVCLPAEPQGWPGESPPRFDIGSPCRTATDCSHLSCLELPGGYCTKTMCEHAGCPSGSGCFVFASDGSSACLRSCTESGTCREAEGYVCDPTNAICWPNLQTPDWDPSLGASDCQSAWGNGGSGLSPCDTTPDDYVVVRKAARNLALCRAGQLQANFRAGLGFAPTGDKEHEGDGKTPEGIFYIPRTLPNSQYYKAFLLSYPDADDARRGERDGLVSQANSQSIQAAQANCTEPPQSTDLGGLIEIHGMGGSQDWTAGCIAVENHELDQLWGRLGVGDTIVVLP